MRTGLVCNFLLSDTENICKKAIELNLIQKVQKFVKLCVDENLSKTENLVSSSLSILNVLTEQLPDLYFESDLNILISNILKQSTNEELSETCVELLQYQAENGNFYK